MTDVTIRFESASARIKDRDDGYWLTNVYSSIRGQGHATGLMERVCLHADANDLTLELIASPYKAVAKESILDLAQLITFYRKFGFVEFMTSSGNVHMTRIAREKNTLYNEKEN